MNKFKDDSYNIVHKDIEKIRSRPTQYITAIGEIGIYHLCKELIDNASDEALKKESPCDSFHIEITDKSIRVWDNGRGIPTDIMQEVYETMQAGTNMTRSGGSTRGENGVGGSTAIVALSSHTKIVSTRPNEKKRMTLEYKEGKLVNKLVENYTGNDHGLDVTFKPSKKVMGEDNIPIDKLHDWLKDFDYTLHPKTHATYKINKKEYVIEHKPIFKFFDDYIKGEDRLCEPIVFSCEGNAIETVMGEDFKRYFKIEVSLMYSDISYKNGDICKSWMNMIHTVDNGSHVDGVLNGLTKFISERIIKKNKKLENEDFGKDIRSHLNIVIKAEANFAHMFASQSKHKVIDKRLYHAIDKCVYETLSNHLPNNFDDIIDCVLTNHRMRKAGEEARNIKSVIRERKKWVVPDSYLKCADVKTPEGKELFIVEGKSAGGGLRSARDARYQAIMYVRGKSLNVMDEPLERVLKSETWLNLVKALGCGIGETFDIKKLNFDKIIITSDADIDGFHIRVNQVTFFVKYYPEIIRQGHLYIAEPPLYKLTRGKETLYVATQNEYIQECIKSIGDIELHFPKLKNEVVTADVFVTEAFNYQSILREVSTQYSINQEFLEHIAYGFTQYGNVEGFINNMDKWLRSLIKIYPEVTYNYDTHEISNVVNLKDQIVILDDDLMNSLRYLIDVQSKYGLLIEYKSMKLNTNKRTTLSTFFVEIEKYYPTISGRYKGLGSSPAKVAREVIMDPRTRRIIRLTMNDALIMKQMAVLVGEGKENKLARKELLMNFEFDKDDIDN